MKRVLKIALVTFSLLVAAIPSYAATISLSPASQSVFMGQGFQVDVIASGLVGGAAPSLGVYDIDINFDPAVLSFSTAVFGDPVLGNQLDLGSAFGSVNDFNAGVGTVNLFEVSFADPADLDSMQADSFILATLSFSGLGFGTSALSLNVNILGDSLQDPISSQVGPNATISVVPEPTGLALAFAGLLALAAVRARRA